MIDFYDIDINYIDYLKLYEDKIPNINSTTYTYHKFMCGVVLSINNNDYYAPISSNTNSYRSSFLICNNNDEIISSVRLSFMIPCRKQIITKLDFNQFPQNYQNLLYQELQYLKDNENKLINKARYIYNLVINNTNTIMTNSCCNFALLEQKAELYIPELYIYQNNENKKLEVLTEKSINSNYNLIDTIKIPISDIETLNINGYKSYINIINEIKDYYKEKDTFVKKQINKLKDIGLNEATKIIKELSKSFDNQIPIDQNINIIKL